MLASPSATRAATYAREREARDPEYKARRRVASARASVKRRAAIRAYLVAYKLSRGCADCGDRWQLVHGLRVEALEFDHINGHDRKRGGSRLANASSWTAVLKELKRVEVVCAICHNVRTKGRLLAG